MARSTIRQWLRYWFPLRFRPRRIPRPLVRGLFLEALEDRYVPASITWLNPASGDWDTAANWSTGTVPTAADDATIAFSGILVTHSSSTITFNDSVHSILSNASISLSSGTISVGATGQFNSDFNLGAFGTLSGAGTVTMASSMTWGGGLMSGSGLTILQGTTNITNGPNLDTRTLNNTGTVNDSVSFGIVNGAVVNNQGVGTWNLSATLSGVDELLGAGTFNNAGTLTSNNSSGGKSLISLNAFSNSGTISVQSGGLSVTSGANSFTDGATVTGAGLFDLSGGTLTATGSSTIGSANFSLTGATLTGSGTVTVTAATTWSAGTMSGTGLTVFQGSTTISGTPSLDTRTLDNAGTLTDNAALPLSNSAVINNESTGDWTLVATNTNVFSGSGSFNNAGGFHMSGAGTDSISVPFNNSDSVGVQSGALTVLGGGGIDSGSFTISGGSTLTYTGGSDSFTDGAVVGGAGTFVVSGGETIAVSGSVLIGSTSFTFDSSTLTGSGTVSVNSAMDWTDGSMSGSGATLLQGSTTISGNTSLNSRTLNNFGTVSDIATLTVTNGAIINNESVATWTLLSASGTVFTGTGPFNNIGTFKQTGTGENDIIIPFNNSGVVNVQSGTLAQVFAGTDTDTGSDSIAPGATLLFGGTVLGSVTYNLNAGSNVTGAGSITVESLSGMNVSGGYHSTGLLTLAGTADFANTVNGTGSATISTLNLSGGILTGTATITVSGATTWSGGTMSGTGATNLRGSSTISGSGNTLDTRTLNNFNTLTQTTDLAVLNGAVINNSFATWDLQNDSSLSGSGTFNNSGTVQKSVTTGISTIGITFNGNFLTNVLSGTLGLDGGGSGTGSYSVATGTTLSFGANYDISVGADVSGPGNVTFRSQTVTVAGGFFATGTTTINGGATANFTNTVDGTGSATITTLSLAGGTLTGSSTITVTGATTWGALGGGGSSLPGTMSGTGLTILRGSLSFPAFGNILDTRTVDNFGAATTFSDLIFANGAIFNNERGASYTMNYSSSAAPFSGSGTFNNLGTVQFDSNRTNNITIPFNNSGVLNIGSGTIGLNGGGTDTGSDSVAAGATVAFGGGTYNLNRGSGLTGAGALAINSGTLNVAGGFTLTGPVAMTFGTANFSNTVNGTGSATFSSLSLGAGTLTGSATVNVTGATSWGTGTMSGSGVTNLLGSSSFFSSFSGPSTLDTRTLNNFGTLTTSNMGINAINGAVLNNESGATWILQTTDLFTGIFNNFGTMNVSGGAHQRNGGFPPATVNNAGTVTLASNSTFTFATLTQSAGLLAGGGILNGNVVVNGGITSPGFSPGILTVNGNYTQNAGGTLNIEIAGATAGSQYDVLSVSGTAQLGGTLNLIRLNGFVPPVGASFQILTASAVSGTFATINGVLVSSTESLSVQYGTKSIVVVAIAPGVASVNSTTPDGTYTAGASINITVTFNEAVSLSGGTLTVNLNDGGKAVLTPFTNSTIASGTYVVAAGQTANPLDSNSPLVLSAGATLTDAAGATVALIIPAGNSLANIKKLVIAATAVSPPPPPSGLGPDRIGMVIAAADGTATWTTDSNADGAFDSGDATFTFGLATDTPLVGDWNKLGFESAGIERAGPNGVAQFALDTNGDNIYDNGDSAFTFGLSTDVPVVGDWNGDGRTKVGVVRPQADNSAVWSLDTNGDGAFDSGDRVTTFGRATDKFGAGDWNGAGRDELAVVRAGAGNTAVWTLDTNGDGIYDTGDAIDTFGLISDSLVVGDWNGDGRTKIGVERAGPNGSSVITVDTNGDGVYDAGDQVITISAGNGTFLFGKWKGVSRLTAADALPTAPAPVSALKLDAAFQADVNAAINLWAQAGLDGASLAQLRGIMYSVSTLDGGTTAEDNGNQIVLDATAAGNGWSEGPAPQSGRIDLQTTLAHEMGHALGLDHSGDPNDVMFATLPPGIRRAPTSADVNALMMGVGGKPANK